MDNAASVSSLRIAPRATRTLKSREWDFPFVISDRLYNQSINLKKWSEIPSPPFLHKVCLSLKSLNLPKRQHYIFRLLSEEELKTLLKRGCLLDFTISQLYLDLARDGRDMGCGTATFYGDWKSCLAFGSDRDDYEWDKAN
ncbi:MAG: hypothetical protein QNL02_17180 [Paracoccaceae bacterium]